MNPETFFDKFELLADTPNGVKKLRELILQLAVQGKLVRQDENDESAAVLLEKIKVEKGKNAKKLKPLPLVSEDEIYFALPIGWQWVRFDDICSYIQRGKGPKYVEKSDIPVISQKCIQWDGFKLDRARFISPSTLEKYNEERFLCTGDLLWNSTGTGTIGRVNTYVHEDNSYDKVVADSHVTVVRPILLNSRFIYCWIASPIIQNEIEEMASGTTNQIELNLSTIKNHLVPIPPLSEQRRIVAKVDQLMALCDELEARQHKKQETRLRLNNAALDKLLTAHEPAEFTNHWQRVCDNFDLLYDNPETVGELRKAILQLAVQGKLVRQDENDEPAAVLLGKIKAEKEQLVREKKIKKAKENGMILKDEYIATFPKNWSLSKIVDLGFVTKLAGFEYTKHIKLEDYGEVPVIRAQNVRMNYIDERNLKYIDMNTSYLLNRCALTKKAILMTFIGAGIGDVAIIDKNERWHLAPNVAKIEPFNEYEEKIDIKYFLYYLMSNVGRYEIFKFRKSTAQPSLSMGTIRQVIVALPPLNEQRRIVAKVDQLMALCDELESKLDQSHTDGAKLMGAVVAELVGA